MSDVTTIRSYQEFYDSFLLFLKKSPKTTVLVDVFKFDKNGIIILR